MDVPSTDNVDDHIGRKSFRWKREKKADEEVAHTTKKKSRKKDPSGDTQMELIIGENG